MEQWSHEEPDIHERWHNLYGDLSREDPVYAAAHAVFRYETALRETEHLGDVHLATNEVDKLQAEKDKLLGALPSDHEREMAIMHAQLALGPHEDPDDDIEIYEVDDEDPIGSI